MENVSKKNMPNVKFIVDLKNEHIVYFLGFNDINKLVSVLGRDFEYGCTNPKGNIFYTNKPCFENDKTRKLVSIYEAIPVLIPDGMRYNKELDKLVPDVMQWKKADNGGNHIAVDGTPFDTVGEALNHNCTLLAISSADEYCSGIKVEIGKVINITLEDRQILDELKKSGKSYLEIVNVIKNTDTFTPSYYGAKCKCGEKLDAYAICDKYSNEHKPSAWHHAVKKLIRAGDGHKPLLKDIDEVIDSLKRWKEQLNVK